MTGHAVTTRWTGASDGDGTVPQDQARYAPCDDYFLQALGQRFMEDIGQAQSKAIYRFDQLSEGYSCWQSLRSNAEGKNNHVVDRYIYGHGNGRYKSTFEFYDHFKHLYFYGVPDPATRPCLCCKCSKQKRTAVQDGARVRTSTPTSPSSVQSIDNMTCKERSRQQQTSKPSSIQLGKPKALPSRSCSQTAAGHHRFTNIGSNVQYLGQVNAHRTESEEYRAAGQDDTALRSSAKKRSRDVDNEDTHSVSKRCMPSDSAEEMTATHTVTQTSGNVQEALEQDISDWTSRRHDSHDHISAEFVDGSARTFKEAGIEHSQQPSPREDATPSGSKSAQAAEASSGSANLSTIAEARLALEILRKSMPGRIMGKERQPGYKNPDWNGEYVGRICRANTEEFEEMVGDFYG